MRAALLLERLVERGVLQMDDLVALLGEARHRLTVVELERALAREARIGDSALAAVKGEVTGYPYLASTDVAVRPVLDASLSKAAGAIVLDTEPTSVAMVEDLPETVARLRSELGGPFEVIMCTVTQFADLHRAGYEGGPRLARRPLTDIYAVFDEAMRRGASDVHVSVGQSPVLRVDGGLVSLDTESVEPEWLRAEIGRLAGAPRLLALERDHSVDMALPYGSTRFRLNFGAEKRGLTLAARKIPTRIPTPDEIGLPVAAQALADLDRGLVLVTGATGSGKSTTLAALLSTIAARHARHVITLEDPIEFVLPQGRGVTHQRELGVSFTSFSDGLRQALRQDPDVVLVGEMRDEETIRTALTAAETGHLVFGTLHTYDAAATVSRIVAAYPAEEQEQVRGVLAYILKATISQTLVKAAAGTGRIAAYEVMVVTPAIANNLRKVDGMAQLRQTIETSSRDGMQTMDMALADLVRRRLVLEQDALEKVIDPEDFGKRL
jgi:twitching motility protein PilT